MSTVAIDVDGVLYNWEKTARFLLGWRWGYELEESTSWSYIPDHISKEAWDWLWKEGLKEGLFRYGHVVKGGVVGVRALAAAGHELYAVTHRPVSTITDTHEWLDFMKLPFTKRFILTDGRPKSTVKADILIDDKIQNVQDWVCDTGRRAILYTQRWNRELDVPRGACRATWPDIPSIISGCWRYAWGGR